MKGETGQLLPCLVVERGGAAQWLVPAHHQIEGNLGNGPVRFEVGGFHVGELDAQTSLLKATWHPD